MTKLSLALVVFLGSCNISTPYSTTNSKVIFTIEQKDISRESVNVLVENHSPNTLCIPSPYLSSDTGMIKLRSGNYIVPSNTFTDNNYREYPTTFYVVGGKTSVYLPIDLSSFDVKRGVYDIFMKIGYSDCSFIKKSRPIERDSITTVTKKVKFGL